ncbi:MAG TPA: ABC transporter permease [bacterium]|nr:ABC transporter permease [bacterium]
MAPGKKGPIFRPGWTLPLLIPVLLLGFWQTACDRSWFESSYLPSPRAIAGSFSSMLLSGELWGHLKVSLTRVLRGFALGAGAGTLLGFSMGLFPRLEKALSLLTGLLRPIPTIAWVPALILWMGIGESSKVTVIAVGSFWPVLLSALQGVRSVHPHYLEVARVLKKNRWTLLTRVILPSALPSLFTGYRVGMGIAWASVVGAELIAASSGIGYLIMYAREVSQPDVMLVGVAAIGLTGLFIDWLLLRAERKLLAWHRGLP